MSDTATQRYVEINTFHLTDDMLKDNVNMDLAPGEGLPVWSNLQRGMCILNSFPISAGQVTEFQRIEDKYTGKHRTRIPL